MTLSLMLTHSRHTCWIWGARNGVVKFDDILEIMPDVRDNMDLLQEVFSCLMERGH